MAIPEARDQEDPTAAQEKEGELEEEGPVRLRVHDIIIRGNTKTRDSLIQAEVDTFRTVSTMQELLQAVHFIRARLLWFNIFDSVSIKVVDSGPSVIPGTVNVVIEVIEARESLTSDIVFSKPEARASTVEGSLYFKNWFGYGDIWEVIGVYGWDQASDIRAKVSIPRFKTLSTPLMAQLSLLNRDWMKLSSYKETLLGLSFGLFSTRHHDLTYDLAWRKLTDPSCMSSNSIMSQLGHSFVSSVKYTYEIDQRDSRLRPTRGYVFHSKSQVGGLGPNSKSLRFIRQEFDIRGAIPIGFFNAALNLGVSLGGIMPWGRGFRNTASPLPERFFMGGGDSSPVCSLGIVSLLGFESRGLGPTDSRRLVRANSNDDPPASPGTDAIGGDLAVTAFADLSFDLPLKVLRKENIHGHVFFNSGNLATLAEGEFENFSFRNFLKTFRSSAGFGLVIPGKSVRFEINYCYILKQFKNDRGKTGIQLGFS